MGSDYVSFFFLYCKLDPSELSLVTCSQRLSQISYSSQITSEDRFVYNAQVKSLNELCELKRYMLNVARIDFEDSLDFIIMNDV